MPATGDCSIHSALCTEFEIFSLSWLGTLSLPSAVDCEEFSSSARSESRTQYPL